MLLGPINPTTHTREPRDPLKTQGNSHAVTITTTGYISGNTPQQTTIAPDLEICFRFGYLPMFSAWWLCGWCIWSSFCVWPTPYIFPRSHIHLRLMLAAFLQGRKQIRATHSCTAYYLFPIRQVSTPAPCLPNRLTASFRQPWGHANRDTFAGVFPLYWLSISYNIYKYNSNIYYNARSLCNVLAQAIRLKEIFRKIASLNVWFTALCSSGLIFLQKYVQKNLIKVLH